MNGLKTFGLAVGLLFLALGSGGCAGSRGRVTATDNLNGPVSFSSSVFDSQGNILRKGRELKAVGRFSKTKKFWGTLFSIIPLTGNWDATDYLNQQMAFHKGIAIVDFKIQAETIQGTNAAWLMVFGLLVPVLPTYVNVEVSGTVVQSARKPPS